jgi:hypothetical protein
MANLLFTVTIVLAEIIVILLIALGIAVYLHFHKTQRHKTEINALMGLARHVEKLPAHPAAQPIHPDTEFADRTNQRISEIRQSIAKLDARFGHFHHESQLREKNIDHKIDEEGAQLLQVRKELRDATTVLHQIKEQYAALDQDLRNLRVEIKQHDQHDMPASPAKPAHHEEAALIDDDTLPDSVLEKLEELAKSASETPLTHTHPARRAAQAKSAMPAGKKSVQAASMPPRREQKAAAGTVKKDTVEEPQYAFDPAQIEDRFSAPLFIPGAANAGINVEELNFDELNLENPHGPADAQHGQPNYDADRVFYQASVQSGIKAGWYFSLRGGNTHGPFGNKAAGERVLNEMIEQFKRTGDSSGR